MADVIISIKGKQYAFPDQASADAAKQKFLAANFSPEGLAKAQQFASYSVPIPNGMAQKLKVNQEGMEAASIIDPDWNVPTYEARRKLMSDFGASGKHSDMVRSFNNAIQHLATLNDSIDALHNHDVTPLNAVGNYIESNYMGDPRVKDFDTAQTVLSQELPKAIRGGQTAEQDVKAWKDLFNHNDAMPVQKKAVATGLKLLNAQVKDLQSQYLQGGVKPPSKFNFLYPDTIEALKKLKAVDPSIDPAQFNLGVPPASSASPTPTPSAPSGVTKWGRDASGNPVRLP